MSTPCPYPNCHHNHPEPPDTPGSPGDEAAMNTAPRGRWRVVLSAALLRMRRRS